MKNHERDIVGIYAKDVNGSAVFKSTAFPKTLYETPKALAQTHLKMYERREVIPLTREDINGDGRPMTPKEIEDFHRIANRLVQEEEASKRFRLI